MDDTKQDPADVQEQVDELQRLSTVARADIDGLQARADGSEHRADDTAARVDQGEQRLDELERHVDVDREMILELQGEGSLQEQQVVQLQQALTSSRRIGAAIGIVMARLVVDEQAAFELLRRASNDRNLKLRDLADELVATGDIKELVRA
jgi:hypothetical protein